MAATTSTLLSQYLVEPKHKIVHALSALDIFWMKIMELFHNPFIGSYLLANDCPKVHCVKEGLHADISDAQLVSLLGTEPLPGGLVTYIQSELQKLPESEGNIRFQGWNFRAKKNIFSRIKVSREPQGY